MQPNKSRQRKLLYAGLVVALFFVMLVHRNQVQETAREANIQVLNLGEVDLGGSITRFVLTSFRGPLICGLWWEAREAQARHEYDQMELVVRALTKLQPHFKKPWQFEAWNLAYNVAVEFDAVKDKYFYVAEGLRWLVEGERVNRANLFDPALKQMRLVGDPDMRGEIGETFQNKFSHADEKDIYRIYLQLSCIPPERRDLNQLRNNPQALRDFKTAYPRLVRRIQEYRFVPEGADEVLNREILSFLERGQENPGLYPTVRNLAQGLTEPSHPFPFWPEEAVSGWQRPANPGLEDTQDSFEIARNWFEFSLEPLPPTEEEFQAGVLKGSRQLSRDTKSKASLVFRANAPRAKSLQAQQLGKEGWGADAQNAWKQAYDRWRKYGAQNSMEPSDEEMARLERDAQLYPQRFPHLAKELKPPPEYLKENVNEYRRLSDSLAAYAKLSGLAQRRKVAHYGYWRLAANTNRTDLYRSARQQWYDAERRRSDPSLALTLFDRSMHDWNDLLLTLQPLPLDGDVAHRVSCLVGPGNGLIATWSLLPLGWPTPTPYGAEEQIQEGLIGYNDDYLKVEAVVRSPALLRSGIAASESAALLGRFIMGGGNQAGLAGTMPAPFCAWRMEDAEEVVQLSGGPFEKYIPELLRDLHRSQDRMMRRMTLAGTREQAPASQPAEGSPGDTQPSRVAD